MLSFLFWNLNGNAPADRSEAVRLRLSSLVKNFDVDVFVFAESRFVPNDLAEFLSSVNNGRYWHSKSESDRIQIFTRLEAMQMTPQFDSADGRLTIRRLIVPPLEILLAAVHLKSQMYQSEDAASHEAAAAQNEIAIVEESLNNYHTLLVGDMNMNPFGTGMVAAQAFHGTMTMATARERTVSGRRYRCFYNPMWGFFGDRNPGPPGTYFYSASSAIEYHWHIFDQVLLRPDLMRTLEEVEILETDGDMTLVNADGRPDPKTGSDHLPILFRLRVTATEND